MSVRLSIGQWPQKIQKKSKLRHLEIESYVSNGWVVNFDWGKNSNFIDLFKNWESFSSVLAFKFFVKWRLNTA